MPNPKILIVDDEVMLVDLIKLRLETCGYDVAEAYDGYEGLSKAEELRPDLIILDINMEKMDGYTMLRHLRVHDQIKDTKVIMLTASGKNRDLFEREGISDYITKPFDTENFVQRVNKVLNNGAVKQTPEPKPAEAAKPEKKPAKPKAKKAPKVKKAARPRKKAAKGAKSK